MGNKINQEFDLTISNEKLIKPWYATKWAWIWLILCWPVGVYAFCMRLNPSLKKIYIIGIVCFLIFIGFSGEIPSKNFQGEKYSYDNNGPDAQFDRHGVDIDIDIDIDVDEREVIATMLNLNNLLCASVISVNKLELKDLYEVECIEYRGGTGRISYIVNGETGRAFTR